MGKAPSRNRLLGLLHLRPGEAAPVFILFAWCFCVVGAFFVGRSVRDALFLANLSPAELPAMYIASPIAVTLVGMAYTWVADRFRRDRLVVATALGLAAMTGLAYVALGRGAWLYYALYVFVNVMGGLAVMQFWTVAGNRFHARQAKRLFGVIAAGGTAANIAVGFSVSALARALGAERLLLLCGLFLLGAAAMATLLYRLPGTPPPARRARTPRAGGAPARGLPPGARHLRLVGALIAATVIGATVADFAFKALTATAFGDDRAGMVAYFGTLSGVTGIISMAIQLGATGRLLASAGVAGTLAVLPIFLAGGFASVLIAPSLLTATLLRGADATFRYTVNDAGMQLLYLPVPAAARGRFKALLESVIKPGSELCAGVALLGYRALGGALAPVAVAGLAVAACWLTLVARMRRAYSASLADTLHARRLDLDGGGGSVPEEELRVVRDGLASADPAVVAHALELARGSAAALQEEVAALVGHTEAGIRRAACQVLARSGDRAHRAGMEVALADGDLEVRVAAAAALVRLDGGDGDAARLAEMIAAPEPALASAAARAAATAADARLAPALAAALERPGAGPAVADALATCGGGAEALAGALLRREGAPREALRLAARALGRLPTPESARLLADALDGDERTRDEAARALARLASIAPDLPQERERLEAACQRELAIAYRAMAAAEGLGRPETEARVDGTRAPPPFSPRAPEGAAALISKALRERGERATDRLFALLAALHPGREIDRIHRNLREPDPARRANAVELLEGALRQPLRGLVVPLVDDSPRYAKLAAVKDRVGLPRLTRDGWLTELLGDPNPWMLACAIYYAGMFNVTRAQARLVELADHPSAMVAETAELALTHMGAVRVA